MGARALEFAILTAGRTGEVLGARWDEIDLDAMTWTIPGDRMMQAVGQARHDVLAPYLKSKTVGIGSINSPMQCMMKEICAQCLQPETDPVTGEQKVVFTCFNQDLDLDAVDFQALHERLGQNAAQEKLTKAWVEHCLESMAE
jgi:hypothetical protein